MLVQNQVSFYLSVVRQLIDATLREDRTKPEMDNVIREPSPLTTTYTCLYIMLYLQGYGSPVGCEAYNARIDMSRYNAMPTMLRFTCRV